MIGFYHAGDMDGISSGALLKYAYPTIKLIGIDYTDDIAKIVTDVSDDEVVFLVDFTFEPFELMVDLCQRCRLIWIDHHTSSYKYVKDFPSFSPMDMVLGDNKKSAVQLLWEYLFHSETLPEVLRIISLFDTWQHNYDKILLCKYTGIDLLLHDVNNSEWYNIFRVPDNNYIDKYLTAGMYVDQYLEQQYGILVETRSFEVEWEGLRFLAVNSYMPGSRQLKSKFDPEKYDAMLVFGLIQNRIWKVSLYTDNTEKFDLSKIANKYGGGGHRGACGFEIPVNQSLPFLINIIKH